ncbi:terminase small subunit [Cellulosilyticum sp. ST5]|uniref:terminase small subunit n=1 Tax=unclassified Cellulosilyticum TaxID=2643091 RepID=UPI000F8C5B70|nr:terminase small subunit [Cellulosilyticum sp. WCF-2]QEH69930.1 phage portal protein [Cellulosilyticum sp. WCF-2]
MPREPNPKIEQGKMLFEQGKKLIEIAEQLEVPEGTVRSWKNRYKWDSEDNVTLQKVKRNVAKGKSPPTSKKQTKLLAEVEQVIDNPGLTDKQRLFCLYYIKSFNATQSYLKAYECDYITANTNGPRMLVNACVKQEIERLKEIKRQQIAVDESDLVEIHMRIAFADMGDYVSFGREEIQVMGMFGPVKDESGNICTEVINTVRLKESSMVDTQLIKEVKQGKDGVAIKLIDRCKSLEWLDKHFLMNPMDRHKLEYDQRKLALAEAKANSGGDDEEIEDDGFLDALKGQVNDVWKE